MKNYTVKHYNWEEVKEEYGATEKDCAKNLADYKANKPLDYTMTVEFYPTEICDNDPDLIKIVVNDFNEHFPESKIEWDGHSNVMIVLDNMEKQLWGFMDFVQV